MALATAWGPLLVFSRFPHLLTLRSPLRLISSGGFVFPCVDQETGRTPGKRYFGDFHPGRQLLYDSALC
jgi:hypothetical protein